MIRALISALAVSALAGSAAGSDLYAITGTTLLRIDTVAQTVTITAPVHSGPTNLSLMSDCEFGPGGQMFAVRQGNSDQGFPPPPLNQSYLVDHTTANALQLANYGNTQRLHSLAYNPATGQMLTINWDNGRLASMNTTTGVVTQLFPTSHGLSNFRMDAMAFAPNGDLYGVWDGGQPAATFDYKLVRINTSTGLATQIGTIGAANVQRFRSLRFDAAGTAYTVNELNGDMYSINLTTGAGTFLFNNSLLAGTTGLAYQVPAPASAGVLCLAGLAASRRRRR